MSVESFENFIDGSFVPALSGNWLDNYEPATGTVYSRVADSTAEDVSAAVEAAERAFPRWSGLGMAERSRFLHRMALVIERDASALARAESRDTGKTLRQAATVDIPRAALNFRFFAGAAMGYASQSHAAPGAINYTLRQPLGAVGCISPWNLPLYLLTWKIAPALAIGNCVVAKPSELTPATAAMLGRVCHEVELPPGVLNIVHGAGPRAGEALVCHDDVRAISFTGGTKTGRQIASVAAPRFKKLSLELGGKNP
ncbi:MAG TPA: aldehyde dehydrogenase family protein, partial [Pirellulaceae bacterium]|nr:aldehyde dehydrogenase family protein [Pirellulaceae bacterium]